MSFDFNLSVPENAKGKKKTSRICEVSGINLVPGNSTILSIIFNQITLTVPLDFRYMDVKRKFLMVLTEIFCCCVKAERSNLFATAALLLVKIFALGHFSLFPDIKWIDWAMVAHHAGPDFTLRPLAVWNTEFFKFSHFPFSLPELDCTSFNDSSIADCALCTFCKSFWRELKCASKSTTLSKLGL